MDSKNTFSGNVSLFFNKKQRHPIEKLKNDAVGCIHPVILPDDWYGTMREPCSLSQQAILTIKIDP
jgi:hypothetical protein